MSDYKHPTITLSDGASIPWLAWGNGSGKARDDPIKSGLVALGVGIEHLDTAQGYNNEKETGQVITKAGLKKDNIWVTSKLSLKDGGTDSSPPIEPSQIRAKVQETVDQLGFIPDLYLIHNPFVVTDLKGAWKVFEELKDEGKLKSIGVSNFRPQDLEAICPTAKHQPVVNQLEFHPFVLTHLEPVLAIQAKYKITTGSYGPLSPALRHPSKGGPLKPLLAKIAKRLDVDEPAVLMLYLKAKEVIAVSSSASEDHLKDTVKLSDPKYTLTKEEVGEIEQIGKKYHFRAYDEHMTEDFPAPAGLKPE